MAISSKVKILFIIGIFCLSLTSVSYSQSSITIQENETGFCGLDGDIDSDHSGYTGSGYSNADNASGNGIDYKINIVSSGTYSFTWRYAHGKTDDRSARLIVNSSTVVSDIDFPGTGSWSTWDEVSVDVSLTSGIKDVRLEGINSASLANIDYMMVAGASVQVASCTGGPVPPSVSITSPSDGATFTEPADITINADASDSDGTVTSVAFYQGSTLLGTDTSSPYSYTWSNVSAGSYTLTAVATDNDNQTTTSSPVNITVNPQQQFPPSVSITSPSDGATFTEPADITINADASDSDGTVTSVAFYQGSTLLGTDTSSPYSYTWSNVSAGSYTLTVVATDNDNLTTTSAPVNITVNPSGGDVTITIQENTTGFCNVDGSVDDNNSGYTGDGFANTDNATGNGIDWKVNIGASDTYTFNWRFANGSSDRPANLIINGSTAASNINFASTDGWTNWSEVSVDVSQSSGIKDVRLEATTSGGLANIDYIEITGANPQAASCTGGPVPPTVSITSPSDGATFTEPADITINADASDSDGTVTSVAFYQGSTLLGTDTSSPYSYTWNNVAAGSYTLTAVATDNDNQTTTSSPVDITVNPEQQVPPTVSITSPSDGATFTEPANITINANASDSDGSVTSVAFYQGSTLLGTDTSSPYSYTWNNVAAGSYTLTAVATDDDNLTTTSSPVNITVNPSGEITIIIQENTTGFCNVDGSIDDNNAGFTGDGFANTDNATGNGIDWKVNIGASDTYTFNWRFANGSSDRPANLIINGSTAASNINFASTGSWTSWSEVSVDVSQSSGIKDVRLEATGSGGLANIDYIEITGANPQAASCEEPGPPTLSVSPSSLGFGSVLLGNSSTLSYTLTGSDLTPSSGNISVSAPSAFEVSTSSGSGFSSSISVSYSNGAISQTIYVRFTPTAEQSYSGNVSNSGGGASTQNVAVSGTGVTDEPPPPTEPDGYGEDATGGGNATPITVSSASVFQSAVDDDNPAVIYVDGRLNVGTVTIGSNKTIIGVGSSSGLYGGTIQVQGNNYIFRNLTFGPAGEDCLEMKGATNIFITKCSFHDSGDELCSASRASDYITISWCHFWFDDPDDHSFAHIIGGGDDHTEDRGRLHITIHHNWYDDGVKGRQPRVRFGHVHLYNNYWNSNNTDYCIGAGKECHIRVENCHFDNVDDPWADYGGSDDGEIGWSNLLFEGCSQPTFMPNEFPVFNPPYSFSLDPVGDVESIVKAGAGPDGSIPKQAVQEEMAQEETVADVSKSFALTSVYPNPFNPETNINYELPEASYVTLYVYDINGRQVAMLQDGMVEAGYHTAVFNASNLASGVYFARIMIKPANDKPIVQTKKLTFMK